MIESPQFVHDLMDGYLELRLKVIDRIIDLTVAGGYVDRATEEALDHMRLAEKASDRIGSNELTPVLRSLDSYILDRVVKARD